MLWRYLQQSYDIWGIKTLAIILRRSFIIKNYSRILDPGWTKDNVVKVETEAIADFLRVTHNNGLFTEGFEVNFCCWAYLFTVGFFFSVNQS